VNHKKGRIFIAGIIFIIITICCYVKIKDCVYINKCGGSLPLRLSYQDISSLIVPIDAHFIPRVRLISIVQYNKKSRLLFQMDDNMIGKQIRQYISDDRGMTWQDVDWPVLRQSDIKPENTPRLASHVDGRIMYECYRTCKDGFPVSTDNGKTWTHVNPVLSNGDDIPRIQLMDTGMHLASRVYARIWMEPDKAEPAIYLGDLIPVDCDFRIGVSDDYGRNFSLLPDGIVMLAESRNNPLMRYGLIISSYFNVSYTRDPDVERNECLAVSKDEGKSWKVMEGSLDVRQKRYERRKSNPIEIRTWKKYSTDYEWPGYLRPMQIESDPKHQGYVYLLMSTGLYFSRDTGKTFRLSSLTEGWSSAVDRIAVDPLDGRYIYATVGSRKFYRSSDYGCTWELMPLPPFPQ